MNRFFHNLNKDLKKGNIISNNGDISYTRPNIGIDADENGNIISDNGEISSTRPNVGIDTDENGNIIEFTGSQQNCSKFSEMVRETGSETEEEPEEINEYSKLETIIAKQRSEIKMLSKNLEIAKL